MRNKPDAVVKLVFAVDAGVVWPTAAADFEAAAVLGAD
jgi:hypothetical protein